VEEDSSKTRREVLGSTVCPIADDVLVLPTMVTEEETSISTSQIWRFRGHKWAYMKNENKTPSLLEYENNHHLLSLTFGKISDSEYKHLSSV
jgi:hypothetical protein